MMTQSFNALSSDAISINEDERIYTSEYSSVLEIRVGVPHLTKFDVGVVRHWGLALMRIASRGETPL